MVDLKDNFKGYVKRWLGIDQIEHEAAKALQEKLEAEASASELKNEIKQARKALADLKKQTEAKPKKKSIPTPKEAATMRNEPWVDVINFHINKENIGNGFCELDWNDQFIMELKQNGYGSEADPDQEVIARWFRDICMYIASDSGYDLSESNIGYIDVKRVLKKNS